MRANQVAPRIPAWLLALTVVAIVGAAARVVEVRGVAGIEGLIGVLLPVAVSRLYVWAADRAEASMRRPLWPGAQSRWRLFLVLLVIVDFCCVFMLLLGRRFIDALGI